MIAPHPFSAVARETDAGLSLELRVIAPWGERSNTLSLYTNNPTNFKHTCRDAWARLVRDLRYAQHLQQEARDA